MLWLPEKNNRASFLFLSALSALLLSAGWLWHGFVIFAFIAWIPLLELDFRLEKANVNRKGLLFFAYVYLAMLIWNIGTTWWILNSTIAGSVMAYLANSALMTIPIAFYRKTRIRLGNRNGMFALPFYWIAFEYLHMNWDLSWSWLNLGNVFAFRYYWVQWYEYTGVLGGTLWIMLVNIFLYRAFFMPNPNRGKIVIATLLLFLPMILSYAILYNFKETGPKLEVVVVQPNINPYTEKFADSPNYVPVEEQVGRFIQLSEAKITDKTRFLFWPETAISSTINEDALKSEPIIVKLMDFVNRHPNLNLVTGITSYKVYESKEKATATARQQPGVGYYDIFNAALWLSASHFPEIYHKSKLVPGVEQLPFPEIFGLLSSLAIDMGGTSGGLGKQETRSVFDAGADGIPGPVICYESIYGDFVTGYVTLGANFIGIITNDGWWGNTPGHTDHLAYASLRAIENRRSIARSANTGISAFINSLGQAEQTLPYWTMGSLKQEITLNDKLTFYSRFGDYIGKLSVFLAPVLLVWSFAVRYLGGKKGVGF